MRIITISRQFGSGGRELGKRLSDELGWDYYDKEIIETLAEEQDMDADYVREMLSHHGWHHVRLTYRSSFSHLMMNRNLYSMHTELLRKEREIIEEIAQAGNDCIIVGRDADVILHEYKPFRIFVCADREARLERCMRHERKKPEAEQLTEKEVLKNIRRIDKNRIRTREILTGKSSSDSSTFDLVVNASGRDVKKLSAALKDFALRWFEDSES